MANDSAAEEHLTLAVDLISRTTVAAIFYTLVLILYYLSIRLSYTQLRDDRGKIKQRTISTMIFHTVLLICATMDIIINNRITQITYIDNTTLPGGPAGVPSTLTVETLTEIGNMVNLVENVLILGVLLWRVWVVWSGTRFATALTITSVFLYISNAVLGFYSDLSISTVDIAAIPRAQSIIAMTGLILAIVTQVFMTSAIIVRLLFVRRNHINLMGKSDVAGQYLSIAAMLIESDALDTLWVIGIFISYSVQYAPAANFMGHCITQVDILTNFLLIYRVLSGRAFTRQTQEHISSLRWASSNRAGTSTSGTVDLRRTSVPGEDPPMINFRDSV